MTVDKHWILINMIQIWLYLLQLSYRLYGKFLSINAKLWDLFSFYCLENMKTIYFLNKVTVVFTEHLRKDTLVVCMQIKYMVSFLFTYLSQRWNSECHLKIKLSLMFHYINKNLLSNRNKTRKLSSEYLIIYIFRQTIRLGRWTG